MLPAVSCFMGVSILCLEFSNSVLITVNTFLMGQIGPNWIQCFFGEADIINNGDQQYSPWMRQNKTVYVEHSYAFFSLSPPRLINETGLHLSFDSTELRRSFSFLTKETIQFSSIKLCRRLCQINTLKPLTCTGFRWMTHLHLTGLKN